MGKFLNQEKPLITECSQSSLTYEFIQFKIERYMLHFLKNVNIVKC